MSFKFTLFLVFELLFLSKINICFFFLKSEKTNFHTNSSINNHPLFFKNVSGGSIGKSLKKKWHKSLYFKKGSNNDLKIGNIFHELKKNCSRKTDAIIFNSEKDNFNEVDNETNEKFVEEVDDNYSKKENRDNNISNPLQEREKNNEVDDINDNIKKNIKLVKGEYYDIEICELLSKSFLSYANFLILNRCLCDYRDGLKTVQRRIIWSMYEINKGINKGSYKKCARIVGEVIGKYHPHGDKSVYDALVRLAQKHHNNNLLINGYGNFGSIEYNAAAMRYTEAKISDFCYDILLDEINDENIEYMRNFDGNEKEPKVLCSKIPLLLINGCSGIAVSILSNIPCHNLIDVINCTISFLMNHNVTNDELFNIIKGPDFPTGGIIISKKNILRNIYSIGKGNLIIRSNVFYEYTKDNKVFTNHINDLSSLETFEVNKGSKKLIIKNLPPNVKPNELIENIINLLNEKKNEHDNILSKIRDESEKDDMRIVLELKKHCQVEQIHNFLLFLFKYTQMEINYHCNFVCIGCDNSYTQFSLKSFIQLWCENRIKFIKKNYQIKNNNLRKELNIIDLYLVIQKRIVEIITFFQKKQDIEEIKAFLKENFQLNDEQIKYILLMKIQKLINIKNVDFLSQKNNIINQIRLNEDLINNIDKIKRVIIEELIYIKNKYGINKINKNKIPASIKYKYTYINHDTEKNQKHIDTLDHDTYEEKKKLKIEKKNNGNIDKDIDMQMKNELYEEEMSDVKGNDKKTQEDKNGSNIFIKDMNKESDKLESNEEETTNNSKEDQIKINDLNEIMRKEEHVKKLIKNSETNINDTSNKKVSALDDSSIPNRIIKNNLLLKGNENSVKNISNIQYRNTYIDSLENNIKEIYNNEEVLVLITYGGYVKKIKINEKLKNHLNNIIKLSNMKYILKENEENVNEQKRSNYKDEGYENKLSTNYFNKMDDNKNNSYKIKKSIIVRNNDKILLTDSLNKAYILNVRDLHLSSYDSKGVAINQIIKCSKNITGLIKYDENKKYLIVCSENGKMKIINNDIFLKKKKNGLKLFKNKKSIYFSYCNFNDICIVGTKKGYIIQFPLNNFKLSKKNSLGNKCINLSKDDQVVDILSYEQNENMKNYKIIFLSKNGFGKMINLNELKVQKKKGKGYKIMKLKKKRNQRKITNLTADDYQEEQGESISKVDDNNLKESTCSNKRDELCNSIGNENEKDIIKNEDNINFNKEQIMKSKKGSNDIENDEFLGFKLYDVSKKKDNDLLIMITDHAILIRKNMSLLKKKYRKQSSHIYAKLNRINKLVYFDIY